MNCNSMCLLLNAVFRRASVPTNICLLILWSTWLSAFLRTTISLGQENAWCTCTSILVSSDCILCIVCCVCVIFFLGSSSTSITTMERAELLCALFVDDDGDLDEDELLLAASVEFGNACGSFLTLPLLPPRLDLFAWDYNMCLEHFRFSREQLVSLAIGLRIPERFTALCRATWRSKAALSLIFNSMLHWLWQRWGQLVSDPFNQPNFIASRTFEWKSSRVATWGSRDANKSNNANVWPGQSLQLENHFRVALDNSNRIFDLLMLLIARTTGVELQI